MRNMRHYVRLIAIGSVMALVAADAVAQADRRTGTTVTQQDVFASVHTRLADAADRTLAAALEDRPWMRTGSPVADSDASANTVEPVVRLRAAVGRVQQLRPIIEPILRDEGVPSELSAVILVESGGILTALSPKGARGIWQFMPDTARRYGLVISNGRDDRLDIARSTHAAARYLRDLHQQFGDWQLAFAAYNAGENAVDRALGRFGRGDFSAIQGALPQETRNYVPAILQAIATLGGNTETMFTSSRDHGQRRGRVL